MSALNIILALVVATLLTACGNAKYYTMLEKQFELQLQREAKADQQERPKLYENTITDIEGNEHHTVVYAPECAPQQPRQQIRIDSPADQAFRWFDRILGFGERMAPAVIPLIDRPSRRSESTSYTFGDYATFVQAQTDSTVSYQRDYVSLPAETTATETVQ